MLSRMPTSKRVIASAEPPWEMKIKGIPAKGRRPERAAMLTSDGRTIKITRPDEKSFPKVSGA